MEQAKIAFSTAAALLYYGYHVEKILLRNKT
jgi:hypothetical protein